MLEFTAYLVIMPSCHILFSCTAIGFGFNEITLLTTYKVSSTKTNCNTENACVICKCQRALTWSSQYLIIIYRDAKSIIIRKVRSIAFSLSYLSLAIKTNGTFTNAVLILLTSFSQFFMEFLLRKCNTLHYFFVCKIEH